MPATADTESTSPAADLEAVSVVIVNYNAGDLLAETPVAAAAALDVPLAPPPAPAPLRARRLSFEALFAPPVVAPAPLEVESWAL